MHEASLSFSLTSQATKSTKIIISGALMSTIGNPVQIRDGPAAVTGDENCICHCLKKTGRRSK